MWLSMNGIAGSNNKEPRQKQQGIIKNYQFPLSETWN